MRKQRSLGGLVVLTVLFSGGMSARRLAANDTPAAPGKVGPSDSKDHSQRRRAERPTSKAKRPAQAKRQAAGAAEEVHPLSKAPGSDAVALLREQVALQQKQIEMLRASVEGLKERLDRALQVASASQPSKATPEEAPDLGQVASATPMVPLGTTKLARPPEEARPGRLVASTVVPTVASSPAPVAQYAGEKKSAESEKEKPAPLSIRVGSADLTVGGFMDFTAIFRSTNGGSGIGTSFGSIPFSNTPAGRLSETRFSAQNSRVSLKATSKVGANNVTGYVEADFLGFQPTNGFVTSNSNSLRMRLYWVDVQRGKFEILGGQSWSMMNPNRTGLSPNPSDIFYSQNMDTNYQVGLTWSRQAQFRLIYHPSKEWAAGISLENPQQFVGGAVVLPSAVYAGQVDTGSNAATPNLHPDIIAKVAYDPTIAGKHMHVEVAGLLRSFRIFDPTTNASTSITGGGGSANANLELAKNFHLILNTFYSDGGGRYIFGLGPDLIVKPDGTPSGVHSASGIGGFEYQFNPKTMLFGYYGGAYYQRNTGLLVDPKTGKITLVGFGFSGSPSSANRSVQEGTFGFIQTFWKSPHYGALQMINQYSYLTRSPWSVASGAPKNAHASMAYVDLRYVLP